MQAQEVCCSAAAAATANFTHSASLIPGSSTMPASSTPSTEHGGPHLFSLFGLSTQDIQTPEQRYGAGQLVHT